MKSEFGNENFEDFLKRSADNLRMRAPDNVWENVANKLNRDRRRFGAGLSAFLLLTGMLGYLTISTNYNQPRLATKPATTPNGSAASAVPSPARIIAMQDRRKKQATTQEPVVSTSATAVVRTLAPSVHSAARNPSSQPVSLQTAHGLPLQETFEPTIVDELPASLATTEAENRPATKPAFLAQHDATPLSIESVVNTFRHRKSRFQTELHFAPTISYRKLSENKTYLRSTSLFSTPSSYAALYGSVNNMVTHKPDVGFELGLTEKFALTQKVRLRAGLQFNVNRYDIRAFSSPFSIATIALNSRRGSRVDSVWTISNYSNVDGSSSKSNWLKNLSFQVSAPVGVELALKGNEKMQFGIATTVQPTYVVGDRAYLITSDYKNYSQVPWLLRRWNVNTAFETFVSYQSGKTRWQVGPQVRYQLLSSFISNYPVKENLFDFGLKVGVSIK